MLARRWSTPGGRTGRKLGGISPGVLRPGRDGHFAITFDEHLWTSDCRQ
jgi:hypothetical protein